MGKYDKQVRDVIEKGKGNFVAIDGSLLCFRASAAGQKRSINVTRKSDGAMRKFKGKRAFTAYLKEKNLKQEDNSKYSVIEDYTIEEIIEEPELKTCLFNVESMIKHILSMCGATEYAIYLDEGETFRHKLATVQEYKGNRTGEKPKNFKNVQKHLIAVHGAHVVTDIEADDVLSMYAYAGHRLTKSGSDRKIIASTFDKDQFSVEGWMFDFRKDSEGVAMMLEPLFIDGLGELNYSKNGCKGFGTKFFYYQWVCGDKVDNYKPSKLAPKNFGERAAHNLLKDCKTEEECFNAVLDQYESWYPDIVTYEKWDGSETLERSYLGIAQEYFNLARMRRWEDDEQNLLTYLETK